MVNLNVKSQKKFNAVNPKLKGVVRALFSGIKESWE